MLICLELYLIRILFELDNLGAIRNVKFEQRLLHSERSEACSRTGMPALLRHFAHGLQYLLTQTKDRVKLIMSYDLHFHQ